MELDLLTSSFLALRSKLHRSALKFLNNDEDARDALHDAYYNLLKQGSISSDAEARNKLFTVLKNVCIDRLRKERTLPLDQSEAATCTVTPYTDDDIESLEHLLTEHLTEAQRHIYILVTHHGMEYEQIAARLGMSVDAVRMNMSRTRKKIRETYKKLNG